MHHHEDELLADFQETYRVNLWRLGLDGDETTPVVEWAAALAYQLPHAGRAWRAIDPTLGNSVEAQLLREVELNQRLWSWAHTKDAKTKTNVPVPLPLPGEEERTEDRAERARRDALGIAEAFGLGGEADG